MSTNPCVTSIQPLKLGVGPFSQLGRDFESNKSSYILSQEESQSLTNFLIFNLSENMHPPGFEPTTFLMLEVGINHCTKEARNKSVRTILTLWKLEQKGIYKSKTSSIPKFKHDFRAKVLHTNGKTAQSWLLEPLEVTYNKKPFLFLFLS